MVDPWDDVFIIDMDETDDHWDLWRNDPDGSQNLRAIDTNFNVHELRNYWVPSCDPLSHQQTCNNVDGCEFNDDLQGPRVSCSAQLEFVGLDQVCVDTRECEEGLICAAAQGQQWCQGPSCCTTYCDLLGQNNCGQGTSCQPLWGADVPFGLDDVGICVD